MKRKTNKIIMLLAVIMLMTVCFAFGASAETWGDYEYTVLEDGTVEIYFYRGNDNEIIIPYEIDGKAVTSIGQYSFGECKAEKIVCPDSIVNICADAFHGAYVKHIVLPSKVQNIGDRAFGVCTKLQTITGLENVTTMGNYVFYGCASLKTISLPNNLTTIKKGTFDSCVLLESVNIPSTVTVIEDGAFCRCETLKEIEIPDGVTHIGNSAFYICYGLKKVNIPDTVKTIGENAFMGTLGMESIIIPESVETIGRDAFLSVNLNKIYVLGKETELKGSSLGYSIGYLNGITADEFMAEYRKIWELHAEDIDVSGMYNELVSKVVAYNSPKVTGTIYLHDDGEPYLAETYAKENNIPVIRYHDFDDSEWVYDYENMVRTRKCELCDVTESEPLNEADRPVVPAPEEDCTCLCHSDGTFIRSLVAWVYKFVMGVLGINKTCTCGIAHY